MQISQDHYLIIDLEATCSEDDLIPRRRMEMIEIGAVMLNSTTLQVEGEYQTFIRPILHPQLTKFCMSLTTIAQQDVDAAPLFPDAVNEFHLWMRPFGNVLFCSWGDYDKHQFKQDCTLHRVDYPFPDGHLNLKKAFSRVIGSTKRFGMAEALEKLGLNLDGTHHRGIDDARNIARIVQVISTGE